MDNLSFRMMRWRIRINGGETELGSQTSRRNILAVDSVNVCLNRVARSFVITHTDTCTTVTRILRGCSAKWDSFEQTAEFFYDSLFSAKSWQNPANIDIQRVATIECQC